MKIYHCRKSAMLLFAAGAWMTAAPALADDKAGKDDKGSAALAPLNACRQIADIAARADCYDKAVDALNSATARKDVVIVGKEEVKQSRRGLFGFNIGKLPIFGDDKDDEKEDGEENIGSLTAKLASIRMLSTRRWRFTLDSGAVWETTEAVSSLLPKAGSDVELKKAALGSYFAKFNGGRAIRAKRVN